MLIPKVEIRILKYKLKYSLITINSLYEFLNLQKKLTDLQSTQNIRQTSPPGALCKRTAPSASAKPEAVTISAMFHAHPFYLNNAAAPKAAAGASACTIKTTTTKD
jgi:hypothetical protein